jgi:hypothetical protein
MFSHPSAAHLAMFLGILTGLFGQVHRAAAQTQDFRIETHVFVGDEPEPVSHTVTLFAAGVVYDFVDDPAQTAVFRHPTAARPGQFILLDPDGQRRTEISTERIKRLMKKLSRWADQQENELLKFSAKPEFEETFDESTGQLTLSSPVWTYHVATVPAEQATALARFREFSDWYARLNTMMHGTPPPMPRLKLNEALARHGAVPVEIRRTVSEDSTELRATHLFSWRLSREDQTRLDEVRRHLANFDKVENKSFLAQRTHAAVIRGQSK